MASEMERPLTLDVSQLLEHERQSLSQSSAITIEAMYLFAEDVSPTVRRAVTFNSSMVEGSGSL